MIRASRLDYVLQCPHGRRRPGSLRNYLVRKNANSSHRITIPGATRDPIGLTRVDGVSEPLGQVWFMLVLTGLLPLEQSPVSELIPCRRVGKVSGSHRRRWDVNVPAC